MKPEYRSNHLLSITRAKSKMYEYSIPAESHINISEYSPAELYSLTIGLISDLSYYVIENNVEKVDEIKKDLLFSAHFFDAFLQSKLKEEHEVYLKIIGASSFYLCDLPGSANVLLETLHFENLELECADLDKALYLVLTHQIQIIEDAKYSDILNPILENYNNFYNIGYIANTFELLDELRRGIYQFGTDRELLFVDILYAIIKLKFDNSSWISLPEYTDIAINQWNDIIGKESFIKELWPAQHLLGKENVYRGKSAVIQMPTSAGKTKSTELIIRSAFLSNRADLAIIVAPFRALCNEIKNNMISAFENEEIEVNEFTDVMQIDEIDDLSGILDNDDVKKTILVSTPEKLYFILKQFPELAQKIGLLIYDEGHQFDSGTRGITYELLLASLKTLIGDNVQTILISAVIGNANEINHWLNEDDGIVVEGTTLTPTYRTVAFTSWLDTLGQIKFVDPQNPDSDEYFVPRVIEAQSLDMRTRETVMRKFPLKNDANTIALYLGLKLVNEGSIAIFSGRKDSVVKMCIEIINAYDRGLNIEKPLLCSNSNEIDRLKNLYSMHFGENNAQVQAVKLGILTHHGNLPQGIKLSVEYALQQSLAKYVICTSTLAQGVNLPIRYLIITSVYQGKNRLKVRDFHNLIGRAGRAGKYTEGSIIFANNKLYDKKRSEKWKWDDTKELLNPINSEASNSSLLSIFDPIKNNDGNPIAVVNLEMLLELFNNPNLSTFTDNDEVIQQLLWKKSILNAIESYILTNLETEEMNINDIVTNTLAYHSANNTQKSELIELFSAIENNIKQKVVEEKRNVYAKSLFGIDEIQILDSWLTQNYDNLLDTDSTEGLLILIWEILYLNIKNKTFKKYSSQDSLLNIVQYWTQGLSYYEIFENVKNNGIKIGTRNLTIEHIIDICEQALSFDSIMIISSLTELLSLQNETEDRKKLIKNMKFLQKQFKYGLDTSNKIAIYELGFTDRIITQELVRLVCIGEVCKRVEIRRRLKNNDRVENILNHYPSYFQKIYDLL